MMISDRREFYTDFVICIDATAKMAPVIDQVKVNAMSLLVKFAEEMEDCEKVIKSMRVKIITFRDYKYDDEPMTESPFFKIPRQTEELKAFLNGIEAKGGSDDGANALEAIALAIKSDWTTKGRLGRHCVFVFSNSKVIPLGERIDCPNYPEGMPADLEELGNWWQGVTKIDSTYQPKRGRFIPFVPECYPWVEIQTWIWYWPVFVRWDKDWFDDSLAYDIASMLVGGF